MIYTHYIESRITSAGDDAVADDISPALLMDLFRILHLLLFPLLLLLLPLLLPYLPKELLCLPSKDKCYDY